MTMRDYYKQIERTNVERKDAQTNQFFNKRHYTATTGSLEGESPQDVFSIQNLKLN